MSRSTRSACSGGTSVLSSWGTRMRSPEPRPLPARPPGRPPPPGPRPRPRTPAAPSSGAPCPALSDRDPPAPPPDFCAPAPPPAACPPHSPWAAPAGSRSTSPPKVGAARWPKVRPSAVPRQTPHKSPPPPPPPPPARESTLPTLCSELLIYRLRIILT